MEKWGIMVIWDLFWTEKILIVCDNSAAELVFQRHCEQVSALVETTFKRFKNIFIGKNL